MFFDNFELDELISVFWILATVSFLIFGLYGYLRQRKRKTAEALEKARRLIAVQDEYFSRAEREGRKLFKVKGVGGHILSLDETRFVVAIDDQEWPCSVIRGVEVLSNGNRVASSADLGSAAGAAAAGLVALGPVGALGGAALSLSKHSEGTIISIRLLIDDIEKPWVDFYTHYISGYNASESSRAPLVEGVKLHAERISVLLQRSRSAQSTSG